MSVCAAPLGCPQRAALLIKLHCFFEKQQDLLACSLFLSLFRSLSFPLFPCHLLPLSQCSAYTQPRLVSLASKTGAGITKGVPHVQLQNHALPAPVACNMLHAACRLPPSAASALSVVALCNCSCTPTSTAVPFVVVLTFLYKHIFCIHQDATISDRGRRRGVAEGGANSKYTKHKLRIGRPQDLL